MLLLALMKKGKEKEYAKEENILISEEEMIKKIGSKIKQLRKDAGYKNYENFAFDNELNRVQYGRMETGINCTIKSLLKVLAVHKMTLNEFFKDV